MINIESELTNYLTNATKPIQEVLMVSQAVHPIWDDYQVILQLANQQILQPLGIFPSEHILAFIGVHSQNIITGKRDSIGFLITNFRILSQTDFSVIGTAQKAQVNLFTQNQVSNELSYKVWNDFFIKNTMSIPQEQLRALQDALKNVVSIVLPQLQALNYLPEEVKKSTDIHERLKDLGLDKVLKTYAMEEKWLKKFAEKHNVSDILFGAVDKPFFGGVYGLVITPTGITSRDLMEDSVTSTWGEIRQHMATIADKNDAFFAGRATHIVPAHQKKAIPSIVVLVNELANGEIAI